MHPLHNQSKGAWCVSTQLLKTPIGIQHMQTCEISQLPWTTEYAHFAQIQISCWICFFIIYEFHLWIRLYSKSICLFFLLSPMAVTRDPLLHLHICWQEKRPSIKKSESWRGIWQHSPVLLKVNWHWQRIAYWLFLLFLLFCILVFDILQWSLHGTCLKICLTVQRAWKTAVGKSILRW